MFSAIIGLIGTVFKWSVIGTGSLAIGMYLTKPTIASFEPYFKSWVKRTKNIPSLVATILSHGLTVVSNIEHQDFIFIRIVNVKMTPNDRGVRFIGIGGTWFCTQ